MVTQLLMSYRSALTRILNLLNLLLAVVEEKLFSPGETQVSECALNS
jgi:hypothetical protein